MRLEQLQEQLKQHIKGYNSDFGTIEFEFPQSIEFGHLSTNIAMKSAKLLKIAPQKLAADLVLYLQSQNIAGISHMLVAGPGFINFYLTPEYLVNALQDNDLAELTKANNPETVVVDYSAPNIAKPLGIHHVLSTVIGQSVVNLLRAKANKVIAWNYLGDWGTQFGKLVYAYKQWGDKSVIEKDPINELLKLYVKFHDEAEKNTELEDFGRLEFKKLENKDPENYAIWEWIVELSKQDLQKVYSKLGGINFDIYSGEADRESELKQIIEDGLKEKVFTVGEKEAIIADLTSQNMVPYIVQKSDGATLYSTRDIASVKHRIQEYGATRLVYVVDTAQNFHFKQLFAVVPKFSWFNPSTKLEHLEFGRMSFADGKMSTRKGNILLLDTILDEAILKAKEIILQKNPDYDKALLNETAEIIGIGSIKYSVLSQAPETNITFDWNKIISFEGNSAPYLQYSVARANSILKQVSVTELQNPHDIKDANEQELEFIFELLKFDNVVTLSASKLKPNLLANYLYDLARGFNSFYVSNPILNNKLRELLTMQFRNIMSIGLDLLAGIKVPTKM